MSKLCQLNFSLLKPSNKLVGSAYEFLGMLHGSVQAFLVILCDLLLSVPLLFDAFQNLLMLLSICFRGVLDDVFALVDDNDNFMLFCHDVLVDWLKILNLFLEHLNIG